MHPEVPSPGDELSFEPGAYVEENLLNLLVTLRFDRLAVEPFARLEPLARYPHEHETWLGYGHSLSDGEGPSAPFAPNTRLNAVILLPPLSLPRRFHILQGPDQREISFWAAVPLYQEELELKLRGCRFWGRFSGADALFRRVSGRPMPQNRHVRGRACRV